MVATAFLHAGLFVGGEWSFARLIAPVVQLSAPPPSSFASINTGYPRFTWKMAVKMEREIYTDPGKSCYLKMTLSRPGKCWSKTWVLDSHGQRKCE